MGARSLALASLICMASILPAAANDRVTFREFRQQNEGLDRNVARQMFRQQYGRQSSNAASSFNLAIPVPQLPTPGTVVDTTRSGDALLDSLRPGRELRARNQSMQQLSAGGVTRVNRGIELDLNSTTRNIVLGKSLFNNAEAVEVNIGGKTQTFSAGSQVTAAEYVAVKQVLNGGDQQVVIDRAGRASGGSVDLGALTASNDVMRASSLVVPKDVITYGDFGRGSDFRLTGDLANFGTIQTLSSRDDIRGGSLRADNISNYKGASINAAGDLHLKADSNLSNFGNISATGNLALSAGGKLVNTGNASAAGELTLDSANVFNRGGLSSASANVTFNSSSSADLVVDNRKGTISALNGAINLRDAAYGGAADSSIIGGDLLSNALNLNSGSGTSYVNVNELTGVVNETGAAAHVWANTGNLAIGSVCLTGDPTFFNTAGAINILGNIEVAEDLTIVAAGSITAVNGVTISAGDATQGYDITLISGASFTGTGTSVVNLGPVGGPPPYAGSGSVSITGKGSKTGGAISFGNQVTISTRATGAVGDLDAGNLEIFAFGKKTGTVNLAGTESGLNFGTTINTGGVNLGTNGNVTIVAEGASKGNAMPTMSIGKIDTTNQTMGPQGAEGLVVIVTSKPVIEGGSLVTYGQNGSRTSAAYLAPGTKLIKGGGIRTLRDILAASEVGIVTGGLVQIATGTVAAVDGPLTVYAGIGMFPGSGALFSDSIIGLLTGKKGIIGDPSSPIRTGSPALIVSTQGGLAAVDLLGTGGTAIEATDSEVLLVSALTLDLFGNVAAKSTLGLIAQSFDNLTTVSATDAIGILSTSATPVMNDGSKFITNYLVIGAQNIGTSVEPFVLNSATKTVEVSADIAYLSAAADAKKAVNLAGGADTTFDFQSTNGVNIVGGIGSDNGTINVQTTGGTLNVTAGAVVYARNNITLTNSGTTSKDKLIIGKGVEITTETTDVGEGDINIVLGTGGGAAIAPPANILPVGNVQILGLGAKAKSPTNTLAGVGAQVTLSNSVSSKNLTFGGGVSIEATQN